MREGRHADVPPFIGFFYVHLFAFSLRIDQNVYCSFCFSDHFKIHFLIIQHKRFPHYYYALA